MAGHLKGRPIKMPKQTSTRPTSDRVREAMFSTLSTLLDLEGTAVLDLYAGSGALGFEALSRGAEYLCAVERARVQLESIRASAADFGVDVDLLSADVLSSFSRLPQRAFDVVFADPPYADRSFDSIVDGLLTHCLVKEGSLFVFECDVLPEVNPRFENQVSLIKDKKYGSTLVQYYRFCPKNAG